MSGNLPTDGIAAERYALIAGGDCYTGMIVEGRAAMERAFLKLHWDPIDFLSLTDEQREMLACLRDEDQWMTDALHGRITFEVKHEDGWVHIYRLVNPLPGFAPEPRGKHSTEEDFQHFLTYSGFSNLSAADIERLREAYTHGSDKQGAAAFAKRTHIISEPHVSGYRLIVGFNTAQDLDAAHEYVGEIPRQPSTKDTQHEG